MEEHRITGIHESNLGCSEIVSSSNRVEVSVAKAVSLVDILGLADASILG